MALGWKQQELMIAKLLGNWWGHPFRRTPGSGGWAASGHRASQSFHGDIVAPPEAKFPFSVEIKSYKSVDLYLSLYGTPMLYSFWEQCKTDANRVHKRPMLIMKEDYKDALMAISRDDFDVLETVLDKHQVPTMKLRYYFQGKRKVMFLMQLKRFVLAVPPAMILP
jgi:hypothetical protein